MELTYKVRGADGKEYGPVNLEQALRWIREGRIKPTSEIKRSDMDYWVAASQYEELQPPAEPETGAAPEGEASAANTSVAANDPATIAQLRSAAFWFYLIAALSLINSVMVLAHANWRFLFGMGITQYIDRSIETDRFTCLGLDLLVSGSFVVFGIFAYKRHTWAFMTGMILFALDGMIFVIGQNWLGVGLHAYVLYRLFRGLSACQKLNKG